jgi:hypothetical protein
MVNLCSSRRWHRPCRDLGSTALNNLRAIEGDEFVQHAGRPPLRAMNRTPDDESADVQKWTHTRAEARPRRLIRSGRCGMLASSRPQTRPHQSLMARRHSRGLRNARRGEMARLDRASATRDQGDRCGTDDRGTAPGRGVHTATDSEMVPNGGSLTPLEDVHDTHATCARIPRGVGRRRGLVGGAGTGHRNRV